MELLYELLVIVIIGGLISVGAYDALKSFIRHLLEKREEKKWQEEPIEEHNEHEENDEGLLDEIHDDVDEILDDAEEIADDTVHGILKPVVGAVKLVGKAAKKVVKLITFWRR